METLKDKPYFGCIVNKMFALDICDPFPVLEAKTNAICSHIERVLYAEQFMGEEIPVSWLAFESSVAKMVEDGTYCADLNTVP